MWFVPKGRYSYPHIRWNQLKASRFTCTQFFHNPNLTTTAAPLPNQHTPKQIYLKDDQLGSNGGPPTPEAALALVESKEGSGGGSGGRGGRGRKEAAPKKEKATRAPSAFLLFTKERRPALTAGLPFAEQQKALSDAWKVRV